ncbi:hypothetical protein GOBAR_DD22013 [Gossypium barbadense]|nr:hypothetical protein GOBAR_DD22013 [Gossypium barbadense]
MRQLVEAVELKLIFPSKLLETLPKPLVDLTMNKLLHSLEPWKVMIIKRVIRSQNRVIVEGKNLVKKHIKQGPGHEGGIFTVEAPFHASNVQVLDPVTGKPCKIGVKYLEDGTKVRVSRGIGASGSIIPRPEILKMRTTPRPTVAGPKDTPMNLVLEKTDDPKSGKGMPEL